MRGTVRGAQCGGTVLGHSAGVQDDNGDGAPSRAAQELDGSELNGRTITVGPAETSQKKKRKPKPDGGDAQPASRGINKPKPPEWRHDRAAGLTLKRSSWKNTTTTSSSSKGEEEEY